MRAAGKLHQARDRPEERGEEEAPHGERDRLASAHAALGDQDVRRVGHRGDDAGRDARPAEPTPEPDLDAGPS